jgi:AmmeMemoRadiSam system protein B/AmmeMemoRadiSam system protein A
MNIFIKVLLLGVIFMVQNCESKEYRDSPHAGTWYPGSKKDINKMLDGFLSNARSKVHGEILALISPHAGYEYSGQVAAYAYKTVENKTFDDVIVIGPSHYYGFLGASVDTMAGRINPLGKVEFDLPLARKIIKYNKNIINEPMAHIKEHSVEIQIPFIQKVIKNFKVVEIVMGSQDYAMCEILSAAILTATKGKNVLIIASSDLSHFHDQEEAIALDNLLIESVSKYDPEMLYRRLTTDSCEACGAAPIITAMLAARKKGATSAECLKYATSGDISGDYARGVVGYLAAALLKEEELEVGVDLGFSEVEKKELKEIARQSIEAAVRGNDPPAVKNITGKLKEPYGIFVTLNKHGNLRGCIGLIIANQPLYVSCQQMARAAALEDPRFQSVNEKELDDIDIEISILTPPEDVKNFSDIVIGRDGLIIRQGYYQGLLLPQVATEFGWSVEQFLEQTCYKAGLPGDAYKLKNTKILKFSAEVF